MKYGWTLEQDKWDRLFGLIKETKWKKTFLDYIWRTQVPDSPGVYTICVRIKNINISPYKDFYNIIYAGLDCISLRRRFEEHCRSKKPEIIQAKSSFAEKIDFWYSTINYERLFEMESCLIDCFGPSANLVSGRIMAYIGDPQPAKQI